MVKSSFVKEKQVEAEKLLGYAYKRITRGWPLFITVFVGVLIASSTFATIYIGSNDLFSTAIDDSFRDLGLDIQISDFDLSMNSQVFEDQLREISGLDYVHHAELVSRVQDIQESPYDESILRWNAYVGIGYESWIWDKLTLVSGRRFISYDEVLLVNSSTSVADHYLGELVNLTFMVQLPNFTWAPNTLELRIRGIVSISDEALKVLIGNDWLTAQEHNLFIVDWRLTWRTWQARNYWRPLRFPAGTHTEAFSHYIQVFLNREQLLNPVDIWGTHSILVSIENYIYYLFAQPRNALIRNVLRIRVEFLIDEFQGLLINLFLNSVPIFFITLYMGLTVSEVSFHLRRRETGLLLSKGFTRKTILRMHLKEALLIGLSSGALALVVAWMIIPVLVGTPWNPVFFFHIGFFPVIFCFIFACTIAILSIYPAASRASKIPTVEALRLYSQPQPKGYRKLLVWTALGLGGYKIVLWMARIHPNQLVTQIPQPGFHISILLTIWVIIDGAIALVALILFLYGVTKVTVQGTTIVYRFTENVFRRTVGDVSTLATRSIPRNPRRTAAVVLLLALVLGYSVQTMTVLTSEQDFAMRSIYNDVGADISCVVSPGSAARDLISDIEENITGIQSATQEIRTSLILNDSSDLIVYGIDAAKWPQIAYYEENWFSPSHSSNLALADLIANNRSIILNRGLAKAKTIQIGDSLNVTIGGHEELLTVVAYFESYYTSGALGGNMKGQHSLISIELLEGLSDGQYTAHILMKTTTTANITAIENTLTDHNEITNIKSVFEEYRIYLANPILSATSNIRGMGLVVAFLLATMGTMIIVTITLKEKQRETALMAARGVSYKQTAQILLADITSWTIFAIIIGFLTGIMTSYGTLQSLNLITKFPQRSILTLFSIHTIVPIISLIGLLITCALGPMVLAARHAQRSVEGLK